MIYEKLLSDSMINYSFEDYAFEEIPPIEGQNGRNWSCAERKILGHFHKCNNNNNPVLFGTRHPCYYCIPALSEMIYYEDKHVWKINSLRIEDNNFEITLTKEQ